MSRYTVAGYQSYWEAVDKMLRYADTILIKKITMKKQGNWKEQNRNFNKKFHKKKGHFLQKQGKSAKNSQYWWFNKSTKKVDENKFEDDDVKSETNTGRRRLPTLPPARKRLDMEQETV